MADFCCQIDEGPSNQTPTCLSPPADSLGVIQIRTTKPSGCYRKFLHVTSGKETTKGTYSEQNSPRPTSDTLLDSFRTATEEKSKLHMLCKQLSVSRQQLSPTPQPRIPATQMEALPGARLVTSPIQQLHGLVSNETESILIVSQPAELMEEELKVRVQRLCRNLPLTIGQH